MKSEYEPDPPADDYTQACDEAEPKNKRTAARIISDGRKLEAYPLLVDACKLAIQETPPQRDMLMKAMMVYVDS